MRLPRIGSYLAALVMLGPVVCIGAAPDIAFPPFSIHAFPLRLGAERFELQEVDVGAKYGCLPGELVGVILTDGQGVPRWSFNVEGSASFLAHRGCKEYPGTYAASVAGVAIPDPATAVCVIQILSCGASCAGYDVHVFRFSLAQAKINPATGFYSDGAVIEEIYQVLGQGRVRWKFPMLTLYVSETYNECPARLKRMTYEWKRIDASPKFAFVDAVAYTIQRCYVLQSIYQ